MYGRDYCVFMKIHLLVLQITFPSIHLQLGVAMCWVPDNGMCFLGRSHVFYSLDWPIKPPMHQLPCSLLLPNVWNGINLGWFEDLFVEDDEIDGQWVALWITFWRQPPNQELYCWTTSWARNISYNVKPLRFQYFFLLQHFRYLS